MKSECEISELLGEFSKEVHDQIGDFLRECAEAVGFETDEMDDLPLFTEAMRELGYVSADDVANTLRDVVRTAEETRHAAVERLRKMGVKP